MTGVLYRGYEIVSLDRTGIWCWNSEYGCGPQVEALKIVGIVLFCLIVLFFTLVICSKSMKK